MKKMLLCLFVMGLFFAGTALYAQGPPPGPHGFHGGPPPGPPPGFWGGGPGPGPHWGGPPLGPPPFRPGPYYPPAYRTYRPYSYYRGYSSPGPYYYEYRSRPSFSFGLSF
ncbi:MAG: hypothetical protein Q4G69_04865 [Planctomycetia bacterium]|nr:hypothetical protein [Planctomycetia bacterium]